MTVGSHRVRRLDRLKWILQVMEINIRLAGDHPPHGLANDGLIVDQEHRNTCGSCIVLGSHGFDELLEAGRIRGRFRTERICAAICDEGSTYSAAPKSLAALGMPHTTLVA